MKLQIESKSLLIGLVFGIAGMFVMAAEFSPKQTGRYQIAGGSANGDGHFAVVDTITGQTWCARANGNSVQQLDRGFSDKKIETGN